MVVRLLAFAVTVVVAGAPIATELCQVLCAAYDNSASGERDAQPRHHHSCASSSPLGGLTFNGTPHACGHADAVPNDVREIMQAPVGAGVANAVPVDPVHSPRLQSVAFVTDYSPPGSTSLRSQLRL
jgi:hypothetical protein